MKPKAIVTGGAGFIGSHLVERLLREGIQVVVIDNLSTGRFCNLSESSKNPLFEFKNADITQISATDCQKTLGTTVDYVFHLAGLADIVPSLEKPVDYFNSI